MRIREVATAIDCNLETVRFYEKAGLIPAPHRSANGYRDYSTADVDRLRFIVRARGLGFGLDEVRSLLRLTGATRMSCRQVDELTRTHLQSVVEKIERLESLRAELQRLIRACATAEIKSCKILEALQS